MTLKKKIGLLKGKIEKQITKQKWKKKNTKHHSSEWIVFYKHSYGQPEKIEKKLCLRF